MLCPHCNMHDQLIGKLCTRCHRTVTYSTPQRTESEDSGPDLTLPLITAAVELFTAPSTPDFSVPDSTGDSFGGFGGGDTGGGGSFGDF